MLHLYKDSLLNDVISPLILKPLPLNNMDPFQYVTPSFHIQLA